MNAAYMRANGSSLTAPWSSMDVATRKSEAHDHMFSDAYEEVQELLDHVLDCKALTSLELDFTNCYCPTGCCRTLHKVMWMFSEGGLQPPAHFRILGTRNQSERDTIISSLGCYRTGSLKATVVFEKSAASRKMQDPFLGRTPFWCHLTE